MTSPSDASRLFYTPQELGAIYLEFADWVRSATGVTWNVPSLDEAMVPGKKGDVIGLIGRPGHGKTTEAAHLARTEAYRLILTKNTKQVVLYVGLEPKAEEMELMFQANADYSITDLVRGRVERGVLEKRAVEQPRVRLPIWFMGRSAMRPRQGQLRLTADNIFKGIQSMRSEYGVSPSLVLIDYIQILPIERNQERRVQVEEAINRVKEVIDAVGCCMVMCVQASRKGDSREEKMPTLGDCQHASALEQVSDKLWGSWRVYLTFGKSKKTISVEGQEYPITPHLLLMRQLKQRFASAGQWCVLNLSPAYVRLEDMEARAKAVPLMPEVVAAEEELL